MTEGLCKICGNELAFGGCAVCSMNEAMKEYDATRKQRQRGDYKYAIGTFGVAVPLVKVSEIRKRKGGKP